MILDRGPSPISVKSYELEPDRRLAIAAKDSGDRLLTKVRLADVIEVDRVTARTKSPHLISLP